jgi:nucleoside-diphosphate-sugar epimerase
MIAITGERKKMMSKSHFFREVVPRITADAMSVNVALVLSFISSFFLCFWTFRISVDDLAYEDIVTVFDTYLEMWQSSAWVITIVSLLVFWFSGFYTFGRAYRSRYKALIITQAVILAYLIFGTLAYLIPALPILPRTVFVAGCLFTLAFVGGSRMINLVKAWLGSFLPEDSEINEREMEKVLVIGGAGYIGSALVKKLLELGYRVRVLDLLIYGDESISEFYDHPKFELVQGDFRNIGTVVGATEGMDAIVHLGAIVGDSACSLDEDLTVEVNLRATRTIAEVGKGFGVKRFVFASTCSVYGASDEILDERSALCPISLYARTKMESEKMLLSLADANFAPVILRFGTIYGLSGRPRFDLVLNLLTAKAIQDGEAGVFGGQQWRPLVHVKDVAEVIVRTLQAPLYNVHGQILNVGSNDQNCQIADLGAIIQEMLPTARVVIQPKEDNRNYRVRFDKIHKLLNFQPRYTLRDGIQEIIDAFAMGQITDYQDPRYNNFNFLMNGELKHILEEDTRGWEWIKLTATDANMLAEIVMAVAESQSPELMMRLRKGLAQAVLGDIDEFLNVLTGIEMTASKRFQPRDRSPREPVILKSRADGSAPAVQTVSA